MNTKIFLILLLSPFAISCNNGEEKETQAGGQSRSADTTFNKVADEFMEGYLAWRPQMAVALGFHEYDGKTNSVNKASLDSELARLKKYDSELANLDTAAISVKTFYDYRILRAAVKSEIFGFEDIETYRKNPMTYAGAIDVSIYVKRDFAPLEERVRSIIAIENTAPALFTAARENLEDSLGKPLIETAIQVAEGSVAFLAGDLVAALKDVKNDSLLASFKKANKTAIDQINAFAAYLKKEKLPKAHNHYAIGTENYKKMLLYAENITMSPESILAIGLKELKKEQAAFNAATKIIDPRKTPLEVFRAIQKDHPSAENLIPEAQKNLEAIRQFLITRKIVTMPSEVRVQVKETPQYARATSTASMDVPGPFEQKATEAYYYITPVDAKWTAKQKEDWLSQFDYYTTDNITIHEAYPGHYTQFLHLNASSATKIEKIFGSYAFIEGWAHYCEEMMADEGYGANGDPVRSAKFRVTQSGDALLRLCRLCVSIKTHCQNMSVDSATKFFMDNWYQGDKPSRQEAIRGTFDPGYLFYTLGKLQILKLREDYKQQEGNNFSLQEFHDDVLDHGMPSIALLREIMLKDKNKWKEIL